MAYQITHVKKMPYILPERKGNLVSVSSVLVSAICVTTRSLSTTESRNSFNSSDSPVDSPREKEKREVVSKKEHFYLN